MKYYSEKLDKLFDTEADLKAAEDAELNKELKRKKAEAEVAKAEKAFLDASKNYKAILAEYNKQYGAYSTNKLNSLFDLFRLL